MTKNKTIETQDSEGNGTGEYIIFCIACDTHHSFATKSPNEVNSIWTFNGNLVNPTFHPSLIVTIRTYDASLKKCHSIVKNGMMEYLGDCTHKYANQTVLLPEIDSI